MVSILDYLGTCDAGEDATPAVSAALADCRAKRLPGLFFPEGAYHFYPEHAIRKHCFIANNDEGIKTIAFYLNGFEDFALTGDNAIFMFHGRMSPFVLECCRNLRLNGFAIDFDRSFVSRGIVLDARGDFMDVQIPADDPYFIEDGKIFFFNDEYKGARSMLNFMEYDIRKKEVLYDTVDSYCPNHVIGLEPGVVRFLDITELPRKGNTILLKHESRLNPGIVIDRSEDISLENVTIRHSGGMGVIAQSSRNIALKKVSVRLPPESNRLVSVSDDAVHFTNCRGHILLEHCIFENQWDDAVNVHGIYRRFRKRNVGARNFIFLEASHFQQMGIEIAVAGEFLEFIDKKTLRPYHRARVKSVLTLNKQMTQVEFEECLPDTVKDGDCVENIESSPDLTVRECIIRNNKPRGLLVTTAGKVMIEGNRFHTPGAAIYISGDANFWFESGYVRNVTIRQNVFDNCNYMKKATGNAVIDIVPEIDENIPGAGYYHKNISIVNNIFNAFDPCVVNARSVDGLEFSGNTINQTAAYPRYSNLDSPLNCVKCKNVKEYNNQMDNFDLVAVCSFET